MTRILRTLSFLAVLLAVAVVPADGAAPGAEGWRAVDSPDLRVPWHLRDVVSTGGSDAIAVGLDTLPADRQETGPAVVLRRSAGQWRADRHYPAKSGPNVADHLFAVDALGPNNVWAVGSTDFRPVAEHWDGRRWRGIPGLADPEAGSEFIDVTIASASTTWAIANDLTVPAVSPVAQRWDGTQWRRFALPHPFTAFVQVLAIEAVGPNDVWAVGHGRSGPTLDLLPIAWHWDGTSWSYQLMPRSGAVQVTPTDLLAVSPTELWMVGYKLVRLDSPGNLPVVQRWDGTAWQEVDGPDIPPGVYPHAVLNSVAPDGQGGIWAAGSTIPELVEPFPETSFFAHFQSGSWTVEIEPDGMQGVINGLAQVPGTTTVWAVGATRDRLGTCGPCRGLIGLFGPGPPR